MPVKEMTISKYVVGKVIGFRGETINTLKSFYHVSIDIKSVSPFESLVRITGEKDQCEVRILIIDSIL